ncbi:MAG: insulinase family protein [Sandaracinaceae bacterium]|nr:insulinase family protein [Sandaracinaceae bacterium]MDW8245831.1 pitrilysin family protein [Sandaracinaceae bacterium]
MKKHIRTKCDHLFLVVSIVMLAGACGSKAPVIGEYPPLPREQPSPSMASPSSIEHDPLRKSVVLIEQPSSNPIVTIRVVFDAGSADDPPGQEGITRLTAMLMAEGGTQELSYGEVLERLFPMAGEIQVQVGRDQTLFLGRVHRDRLDEFYEIMRDVLLHPRMGESDFERLRTQALTELTEELRQSNDEALAKAWLQAMVFEGHPYAHPELGTERSLRQITLEEVRTHREKVFCMGRATIGLAGNYPQPFADRVVKDIERLSGPHCVGRRHLPPPPSLPSRIAIISKEQASSVAVSMGFAIEVNRNHPDYPALTLAASWLGQHRQFVGALMREIREKRGMNYGDYAYAEHFEQDGWSTFPLSNTSRRQSHFSIWLRPLKPEQAHFAIRLAIYILRRLVEEGLSLEEIQRMKRYLDGYYPLFFQKESQRLGHAIDDRFYGLSEGWLERLRRGWATLTPEGLHQAIKAHLKLDRLQIAIVGPNAEELAQAIAEERESDPSYPEGRSLGADVEATDRIVRTLQIGIPRERISILRSDSLFK